MCVAVLDQGLAAPSVARDLRATVRVARGLCLAGLEDTAAEFEDNSAEFPGPLTPLSRNQRRE